MKFLDVSFIDILPPSFVSSMPETRNLDEILVKKLTFSTIIMLTFSKMLYDKYNVIFVKMDQLQTWIIFIII